MDSQTISALLGSFSILGALVRMSLIALLLTGLWIGLSRSRLDQNARVSMWLTIAAALFIWVTIVTDLAREGAFQSRPGVTLPAIPLAIFVPVLIGLILLMRSARVAAVLDAAPPSWLIGVQVYRIFGGTMLLRWAAGELPSAFALPAGGGDVLVGVLALPVAFYLASGAPGGRTAAYAWNLLGIFDLLFAISMGAMTSPGRLQMFAFDQPNLLVGAYPNAMIPAFGVPLSLIVHGLSIWQLNRAGQKATQLKAA